MMSKPLIRLTVLILIPLFAISSGSSFGTQDSAALPTSWTIMVYMAADSSGALPWEDDINEMEAAQQAAGTNIVALVDPSGPANTMLLRINHDPNGLDGTIVSAHIDDGGAIISGNEVDMADPLTLSSFIGFATSRYPAQRNILILWGHGAEWHGMCPDGLDLLTLPELESALSNATTSLGKTLDIIAVDACAEGSIEMAYEIREYAKFFVASEKDVPFEGLPYVTVLNHLAANVDQPSETIGSMIADDYVTWGSTSSTYSVTMGVFNLSRMDALVGRLGELSFLAKAYDGLFHSVLQSALTAAESYENDWGMDFGNLMHQFMVRDLPLEVKHKALETALAYSDVVVHFRRYSNPDPIDGIFANHSSGLVILAPGNGPEDSGYASLDLGASIWDEFSRLVRRTASDNDSMEGPSLTYPGGDADFANAVVLDWPDGYENETAYVFRNEQPGMVLVSVLSSDQGWIRIDRVLGNLTISASATINGSIVTYKVLDVRLHDLVPVNVTLHSCGRVIDGIGYSVTLIAVWGRTTTQYNGQAFTTQVLVPDVFNVGELTTVEVTDGHGHVVGISRFIVNPNGNDVDIEVFHEESDLGTVVALLLISILPGALILLFDLSLYLDYKKKKGR